MENGRTEGGRGSAAAGETEADPEPIVRVGTPASSRAPIRWGGRRQALLFWIAILLVSAGIVVLIVVTGTPSYQKLVTPGLGPKRTAVAISYPSTLRAMLSPVDPADPEEPISLLLYPRAAGRLQQVINQYILRIPAGQRVNQPITMQFILLQREPDIDAEIARFRATIGASTQRGETFEIARRFYPAGPAVEFQIRSPRKYLHWTIVYLPARPDQERIEVVVRYLSSHPFEARQLREIDDVVSRLKLVQEK